MGRRFEPLQDPVRERARKLRGVMSEPEKFLWFLLRDRRFADYKFRRQRPVGRYVVDFICLERRLVVKLDGAWHGSPEQRAFDAQRTLYLEGKGYRVLRIAVVHLYGDRERVLDGLHHALQSSPPAEEGRAKRSRMRGKFRLAPARGAVMAIALALAACAPPAPTPHAVKPAGAAFADDIPVAHTPAGGYGATFPAPVLAACTEPLAAGAPDLRGIWRTLYAERGGKRAAPDDRIWTYVERIEQCGNRIVDMGGGTIADARADGTEKNGVHDVSAFGYTKRIRVIASYEHGVFVLKPLLIPLLPVTIPGVVVTRRLDADGHMVWTRPDRGGLRVVLERIGGPNDPYTRPGPAH